MKYAIWNLKVEDDGYLTGPEGLISQAGGRAEAAWADGKIEEGGNILGYVSGDFTLDLTQWNYREISAIEALAFAQAITDTAFIREDGIISSGIVES